MSATRPIPHIKWTKELEDAAAAVTNAKDSKGLAINLCTNPMDEFKVRDSIKEVSRWFDDPSFYAGDEVSEINICDNLLLLVTLLREHIRAGNTT